MDQIAVSSKPEVPQIWVDFAQFMQQHIGLSEDKVTSFLTFIGCHPELRALVAVCQRLQTILPWIKPLKTSLTSQRGHHSLPLSDIDIDDVLVICASVIQHASSLNQSFPSIVQPADADGRAPFQGLLQTYPLYTALWHAHPNTCYNQHYCLLQAVVLLCHQVFRTLESTKEKDYDNPAAGSGQLLRLCASTKAHELEQFLAALPYSIDSLGSYYQHVKAIIDNNQLTNPACHKAIKLVERILRYALTHAGGYNRKHKDAWEAILNREPQRNAVISADADNDDGPVFSIECIQMFSQTDIQEKDGRLAGCAPGEVKTGVEHLIIEALDSNGSSTAGRSPIAHAIRCRSQYRLIALSNQLSTTRWECLSAFELAMFIHEVSNLALGAAVIQPQAGICMMELAALLSAVYWTGGALDAMIMARFDSSASSSKVSPLAANEWRYVENSCEWWHGALRPVYHTHLDIDTKAKVYDSINTVRLPIENGHHVMLNRWLNSISLERETKKCKRLFYRDKTLDDAKPYYQKDIKVFLKAVNQRYHTRLTLKRIENDLLMRLYHAGGDLTDAMIITGRSHLLGNVALHYSTPDLARLQALYQDTCRSISESVYRTLLRPVNLLAVSPASAAMFRLTPAQAQTRYCGGRYYLRHGVVAALVQDLSARFSESLKFAGQLDYWMALHNDYTLYVASMLGFASGYRAVRDPLNSIDQIDWDTGFCCISDKDNLDYYNSRLIWLPTCVREQLSFYQAHCQRLAQHVILINPSLAKSLRQHGQAHDDLPFLFLLQSDGGLLHLRPSETKKRLSDIFKVPGNVNRSYLRNRLRELGCAGELINYFLGHWENGQEPFGLYASLSPRQYQAAIAPYLTALLEADGWCSIKGLAAND